MSNIYVVYQEGYVSEGWIVCVGLDKLKAVKFDLEKEHNQNSLIKVYDSETMEYLFECDTLKQQTNRDDPKNWCRCPECKDNDETVRYLVDTKQGNYLK